MGCSGFRIFQRLCWTTLQATDNMSGSLWLIWGAREAGTVKAFLFLLTFSKCVMINKAPSCLSTHQPTSGPMAGSLRLRHLPQSGAIPTHQLTWVCAKRPTNQEESRLSGVCALPRNRWWEFFLFSSSFFFRCLCVRSAHLESRAQPLLATSRSPQALER